MRTGGGCTGVECRRRASCNPKLRPSSRLFDRDVEGDDPIEVLPLEVPLRLRLGSAFFVRHPSLDAVLAGVVDFPQIRPSDPQPLLARLFDVCVRPRLAAVDADLDALDPALPAPRQPANRVRSSKQRRVLVARIGDD